MRSTLVKLCACLALMTTQAVWADEDKPAAEVQQSTEKTSENAKSDEKSEAQKNDGDDLLPVEQLVIERTNAERRRFGLRPLRLDARLQRQARRHTAWMTNSRNFSHSSYGVAENIAMGQHNSKEALNAWMNSSGHRANILNASSTKIGVAAYIAKDGTVYWCQQFSR